MIDSFARAFLPRPLRTFAGRMLETALNKLVALDPDTQSELAGMSGQSIRLQLDGPNLAMTISVADGKLVVHGPDAAIATPTLRLSATPGSWLAMAVTSVLHHGDEATGPAGKIEIAGDAELARRLEKLARHYAPDFEAAFAHVFGAVLGVPMARTIRKVLGHVGESSRHFVEDSIDWLRDESRLTVAPAEMDGFLDGVDELHERVGRLAARLTKLGPRKRGS